MPSPRNLDSIGSDHYNPTTSDEIGKTIQLQLEQGDLFPFPPPSFKGAGLYALYYKGNNDLYAGLVSAKNKIPIYVGKAEAGNSSYGDAPNYKISRLFNRIQKHSRSVADANESETDSLKIDDFQVRYLKLQDAWIVFGERALLRAYRPILWNTTMVGFGSNAPGTGRENARSFWDTVHPGRPNADECMPNRSFTLKEMKERIYKTLELSAMADGDKKEKELISMRKEKRPAIWELGPKSEGKKVRVADCSRFLEELIRLNMAEEISLFEADQKLFEEKKDTKTYTFVEAELPQPEEDRPNVVSENNDEENDVDNYETDDNENEPGARGHSGPSVACC